MISTAFYAVIYCIQFRRCVWRSGCWHLVAGGHPLHARVWCCSFPGKPLLFCYSVLPRIFLNNSLLFPCSTCCALCPTCRALCPTCCALCPTCCALCPSHCLIVAHWVAHESASIWIRNCVKAYQTCIRIWICNQYYVSPLFFCAGPDLNQASILSANSVPPGCKTSKT